MYFFWKLNLKYLTILIGYFLYTKLGEKIKINMLLWFSIKVSHNYQHQNMQSASCNVKLQSRGCSVCLAGNNLNI